MIEVVNETSDPCANPQAAADGAFGLCTFLQWRRISPAFPLRVKGEPCVSRERLHTGLQVRLTITLSWVKTPEVVQPLQPMGEPGGASHRRTP